MTPVVLTSIVTTLQRPSITSTNKYMYSSEAMQARKVDTDSYNILI